MGSCNHEAKRIWLNLELAKKQKECLEYIVVHEMVLVLERNHGARFVALMMISFFRSGGNTRMN